MAHQSNAQFYRQALNNAFSSVSNWFRDHAAEDMYRLPQRRPSLDRYLSRKKELPNTLTSKDWQQALEYWGHKCAVCGRPRGLWHTISQDHWIPLTSPDCPGTHAANILPLCYGADGCNNSKGKQMPDVWLAKKLGKRRAARKMAEIEAYFSWVQDQNLPRLGCPHCGGRVSYDNSHREWGCVMCESTWSKRESHRYENCPKCQCWMIGIHGEYICPRCNLMWDRTNLPTCEKCPGCHHGSLKWVYHDGQAAGWWSCRSCHSEWLFE
jgi:hypothetical protein